MMMRKRIRVPIACSNKTKSFLTGLCQFFEQLQLDEEKCYVIFKAISTLDNANQVVVNKLSPEKERFFFFK